MKDSSHITGFGLVETIVAFLIVSLFTLIGIQAFVSAVAIKAKAKQESDTTNWIQESIETDKQAALDTTVIQFTSSLLSNDVSSTDTNITVDSTSSFRLGDDIIIGSDSVNNVISGISGNVLTLNNAIGTEQNQNTPVIARCRSGIPTGGFADYLNDNLPAINSETNNSGTPNVGVKTISGRQYTLTRTANVRPVEPYSVSQLNYQVRSNTGEEIANISTEVVPNAFFQCP